MTTRLTSASVVWLCAAVVGAADVVSAVTAGCDGRYRAGSWTPLVVSAGRPGDELAVAVQDPDGVFVRSPSASATGDPLRFSVRFGRPAVRVRIDNLTTGAASIVDLPPPLPSTTEVWLAVGELPALGRAARLMARGDARPVVIGIGSGTSVSAVGAAARDFDGVDTIVACGRALAAVDAAALTGMDAWIRDGGRLLLAAGTSARALAAAGGPAAGWLPGPVADMVPLRRVAALETHARAGGLADRPATADLRVPLLANRRSLAAAIDVFEGGAPTDLPLVVRRAHGFGSITWIGLDLDAEPFRAWPGTDTLLVRLLGGRVTETEPTRSLAAAGTPDLAGQLRIALEAPGFDGGTAPVPFALIAGLGLLYVACIFPLEWWLVSRAGRPRIAWLSLPTLVVGFTAVAWSASAARRQAAADAAGIRAAEIVDVDAADGVMRGRGWLAVWQRDNGLVDVALDAGQGSGAAVSWFADSGPGFGAIDAAVAHPTLAAADYAYGDSLARLEGVPIAAVSTRLFEAAWSGTAAETVEADLVRDGQGTLRGWFTHHLPFTLRGCRLAHGGWAYDVGDLAPGVRHDLASGRGPRSLAGALARREAVRERQAAARWDPAGTDITRILEVAGLHAAAGGAGYTGLESGRLARLDLSPLLTLDRAVLVGTADVAPAGWTAPWRVDSDGDAIGGPPPGAARLYRIVIPLTTPGDAGAAPSDAAGAAAE